MSPQYGRAGVYVTEQLAQPIPSVSPTGPSVAAFLGEHWAGPVNVAVLCNSWADFKRVFGGFQTTAVPALANTYLPFAVYEYFLNGGQQCYVARVASTATPGVSASVTLLDVQATPQATLELQAGRLGVVGDPGTWGNSLNVQVSARGAPGSGRFDLTIYDGAALQQNIVEAWIDLSMAPTDARYVVAVLNSPLSGSLWVVAGANGQGLAGAPNDTAAAPNNSPNPGTFAFTGGVDAGDPSTADRINAVTYGQSPFDSVSSVLNLNLPGEVNVSVVDAAITYAQTRPYTFLVVDPPSGLSPASAVSYLQSLAPVSSYAAVYYPWVYAPDPSSQSLGNTKLLPPGGFVLGQMTKVDASLGPWKAPAGTSTVLAALQAERKFTPTDLDTLNQANVNALRTQANGSVVIWGARTLQSGYASLYVPVRRALNYIEHSLVELLQPLVFGPNNAVLWGTITAIINQFLSGLWSQNAFYGNTANQAYYVTCDATNNTPQTVQSGIVNAQVGVALVYPAEFIAITVTQFLATGQTSASSSI
jgi:phage tail sheath protein FI